ncbi:MAG: hypothetical protein II636_00430 [Bacteroidales bacterium]|nr:hypothetical protein [Bacteroidales bacterium]
MNKKRFVLPYVALVSDGGEGGVIGHGSGNAGSDPISPSPCSYAHWLDSSWKTDYNEDGEFSVEEFAWWWLDQEFSSDDWAALNPDLPPLSDFED